MDILVEKLRREKHFVDKTGARLRDLRRGGGQLALARRDQDAMDAVGEFEMRCVRLKTGLTKLYPLGEVDVCEVTRVRAKMGASGSGSTDATPVER